MKKLLLLPLLFLAAGPARADFGDADFPVGTFDDGPKSYHDAWCRKVKNKCRVRFAGPAMSVEGCGITSDQFITFKADEDGDDFYTYLTYMKKDGKKQQALFLFSNYNAHLEFLRALMTWRRRWTLPQLPTSSQPGSTGDPWP